jgi:hypothetical protein
VAKYTPQRSRDGTPSPSWRVFPNDPISKGAACDIFAVPTAAFRKLYGFVFPSHDRRNVVHVNVTAAPTADRTSRQIATATETP